MKSPETGNVTIDLEEAALRYLRCVESEMRATKERQEAVRDYSRSSSEFSASEYDGDARLVIEYAERVFKGQIPHVLPEDWPSSDSTSFGVEMN